MCDDNEDKTNDLPIDDKINQIVSNPSIELQIGKTKSLNQWNFFAANKTHLRDILTYKYIFSWILGISIALITLILVEYGILKLFKISFCDIPNNTDPNMVHLNYGSTDSIIFAFQQLISLGFCYSFYWIYHSAEVIGINKKYWFLWTFTMYSCSCVLLFCNFIFIIPINFGFISFVTPLVMLNIIIFAFIGNRLDGVRRIMNCTIPIVSFAWINYIFGRFVFSEISPVIFALMYPFYITLIQITILKCVSIFDIPNISECIELNRENKSSGSGLGSIYYWSDRDVYVVCAVINIYAETYRVTSLIYLKNDTFLLIVITCILSIISEICTRNNLYRELIYRVICKKAAPPSTRVYSIYMGCKLHTEYIPTFIIIIYNLLNFGYTSDCKWNRIQGNMDISDKYWFIAIFILLEITCDLSSYWSNRLFQSIKIFDKEDEARRIKYVKLKLFDIILACITLVWFSLQAFQVDANARQLT